MLFGLLIVGVSIWIVLALILWILASFFVETITAILELTHPS